MSEDLDINEIWDLYALEGSQSLDDVEACLLTLQQTPNNIEAIARLFRAMHTYKGNARMLGLSVIESVAHQSEDMIGLVRDDGVVLDDEIIELLFEATDCLRSMLEFSVANQRDASSQLANELCQRFIEKIADNRLALADKTDEASSNEGQSLVLQESIIFEPLDNAALADDPVYREIFREIAFDNLQAIQTLLINQTEISTLRAEVEQLHYAAEQMGMGEWSSVLGGFLSLTEPDTKVAQILSDDLQALYNQDFVAETNSDDANFVTEISSIQGFFTQLQMPLQHLAELRLALGEPENLTAIVAVASDMMSAAKPHGFVRLVEVLEQFIVDMGHDDGLVASYFPDFEFKLYRELAAIAELLAEDELALTINPRNMLRQWCAEHLFDNLLEMRLVTERLLRQENLPQQCERMVALLHQIYHACLHYGMDTAAHLCMSILDLYSRAETNELVIDAMLLHITKSFIKDIEVILDSAELGETPDLASLHQLLQDTADVTFVSSGTLSSAQIEARLGLPKSFHKVLTPESIKTVVNALELERCFYIIRADLNNDEELAGQFIHWLSSGTSEVISNVTVFEGAETLYDFLIASSLSEESVYEALSLLDPKSQQLRLEAVLFDRHSQHKSVQISHQPDAMQAVTTQSLLSSEMLEIIGELVTGQSMVQHLLTHLFESDLPYSIDAIVKDAGQQWHLAKGTVKQVLENWQSELEKLIQLEAHHTALLSRLQDEAISLRVRPAALLLKPLQPFCENLARQTDRKVILKTSGDEIELDYSMVDQLKSPLRDLLELCITQSIELPEQREAYGKSVTAQINVHLVRYDDHVKLSVSDDGVGFYSQQHPADAHSIIEQKLSKIRRQLHTHGGDLQELSASRFQISLPLAMVSVEGMVVRVDAVKYVIPIQGIQTIIRSEVEHMMQVSADGGKPMLRLSTEDVIPIQLLAGRHDQKKMTYPTQHGLYVIVRVDNQRVAIVVDELIGQQQVLIRPLQGYLASIRGVTGCALLASSEIGLLLDVSHLLGLK